MQGQQDKWGSIWLSALLQHTLHKATHICLQNAGPGLYPAKQTLQLYSSAQLKHRCPPAGYPICQKAIDMPQPYIALISENVQ